jgi:hypothetical protein
LFNIGKDCYHQGERRKRNGKQDPQDSFFRGRRNITYTMASFTVFNRFIESIQVSLEQLKDFSMKDQAL